MLRTRALGVELIRFILFIVRIILSIVSYRERQRTEPQPGGRGHSTVGARWRRISCGSPRCKSSPASARGLSFRHGSKKRRRSSSDSALTRSPLRSPHCPRAAADTQHVAWCSHNMKPGANCSFKPCLPCAPPCRIAKYAAKLPSPPSPPSLPSLPNRQSPPTRQKSLAKSAKSAKSAKPSPQRNLQSRLPPSSPSLALACCQVCRPAPLPWL